MGARKRVPARKVEVLFSGNEQETFKEEGIQSVENRRLSKVERN